MLVALGDTSKVYWKSIEAAKLFGIEYEEEDIRQGIQDRIELLKKVNHSPNGWKSVVLNDGIEEKYSEHNIQTIRHKALYLVKSYLIALEEMNTKSYSECCNIAAKELSDLGLIKAAGSSISKWNMEFRQNTLFSHPGKLVDEKERKAMRDIFKHFPQAKDMFIDIANKNLHQMTSKFMADEFATTILPELEKKSREDGCFNDGTPAQKMLVRYLATPPSQTTVMSWLKRFDIEWDMKCTQRGRNGTSKTSNRMREAWAAGKFASRRPKGQGLKRKRADGESNEEEEKDDQQHQEAESAQLQKDKDEVESESD
jgi:arsenate reductase-like glutaredoxin family protein